MRNLVATDSFNLIVCVNYTAIPMSIIFLHADYHLQVGKVGLPSNQYAGGHPLPKTSPTLKMEAHSYRDVGKIISVRVAVVGGMPRRLSLPNVACSKTPPHCHLCDCSSSRYADHGRHHCMMAWSVLVGAVGTKKHPIPCRHCNCFHRHRLSCSMSYHPLLSVVPNLALDPPTRSPHDGAVYRVVHHQPPRQRRLRKNHRQRHQRHQRRHRLQRVFYTGERRR